VPPAPPARRRERRHVERMTPGDILQTQRVRAHVAALTLANGKAVVWDTFRVQHLLANQRFILKFTEDDAAKRTQQLSEKETEALQNILVTKLRDNVQYVWARHVKREREQGREVPSADESKGKSPGATLSAKVYLSYTPETVSMPYTQRRGRKRGPPLEQEESGEGPTAPAAAATGPPSAAAPTSPGVTSGSAAGAVTRRRVARRA
jgi:hypothetical protein